MVTNTQNNQLSKQRTKEQKRAEDAWKCVSTAKGWSDKKEQKEFRSLAKGAAADIQINGLGQTLAFWRAKGENAHIHLFNSISNWIKTDFGFTQSDLLSWIRDPQTATDDYRRATVEAIAYLIWIKRFAEAELPKE